MTLSKTIYGADKYWFNPWRTGNCPDMTEKLLMDIKHFASNSQVQVHCWVSAVLMPC